MIVTQHARFTAMFRLLRQNDVIGIQDALAFHQLEQTWHQFCGLRRADLLRTLDELVLSGCVRQQETSEGMLIELTDRGVLQMQNWLEPFASFRWSDPLNGLSQQINTTRVLSRAKERIYHREMAAAKRSGADAERRSAA